MANRDKRKRLKPAGHSATIEALIQPAIVIGSTLMSAIAAYVLALDEITRILNHRGTPSDVFVVVLCAGMGFLVDMAIIVSATRYKMHAVRADPREQRWLLLAKAVLIIGLSSEAMTLFYFFVHLDPAAFPPLLLWLANLIHAILAVARAFLPPVVIAYFAAGILPVTFDRSDRNREIKSITSTNIITLIDRLAEVHETDDTAEQLRALGGQLMLDTYATYDVTARTTEEEQLRRDGKLLHHIARIHRLDWSSIAEDVAPALASTPTAKRQEERQEEPAPEPEQPEPPAPTRQPEQLPAPARRPAPTRKAPSAPEEEPPALAPAASTAVRKTTRTAARNTRRGLGRTGLPVSPFTLAAANGSEGGADEPDRLTLRQRREDAARRILAEDPTLSAAALARRIAMATQHSCGDTTARELRSSILAEMQAEAWPNRRAPVPFAPFTPPVAEDEAEDEAEGDEEEVMREN